MSCEPIYNFHFTQIYLISACKLLVIWMMVEYDSHQLLLGSPLRTICCLENKAEKIFSRCQLLLTSLPFTFRGQDYRCGGMGTPLNCMRIIFFFPNAVHSHYLSSCFCFGTIFCSQLLALLPPNRYIGNPSQLGSLWLYDASQRWATLEWRPFT